MNHFNGNAFCIKHDLNTVKPGSFHKFSFDCQILHESNIKEKSNYFNRNHQYS